MASVPVPRPDDQPDLRLSDAERDEAAVFLREHMTDGRLSLVELEERLEVVYGARTRGDLVGLFDDLPQTTKARRPGGPPVRPRRRRGNGIPEHLRLYLAVNALMVIIWAMTDLGGYFWPMWVIVPWGFVILLHMGGARNSD